MPKFQVTALESVKYLIEVEAETASEAESLARDMWNGSTAPNVDFEYQGYGIEITHVIDENGQSV